MKAVRNTHELGPPKEKLFLTTTSAGMSALTLTLPTRVEQAQRRFSAASTRFNPRRVRLFGQHPATRSELSFLHDEQSLKAWLNGPAAGMPLLRGRVRVGVEPALPQDFTLTTPQETFWV